MKKLRLEKLEVRKAFTSTNKLAPSMSSRMILSVYTYSSSKTDFYVLPKRTHEKLGFSALKIGQEWELGWCFWKSERS